MRHSWAVLLSAVVFSACGGDEEVSFSTDALDAGNAGGSGGSGASTGGRGGGSDSGSGSGGASSGGTAASPGDGSTDAVDPLDAAKPDDAAPEPDGALGSGGAGGTGSSDAAGGSPEAGSDACARPTVYYADKDRDRYGSLSHFVTACVPPPGNWSLVATDCNDDDSRVHPGQAAYFGTPYRAPNNASSFDYDCSGTEEDDPALAKAPENCGVLSLALCAGEGYKKTPRVGPGLSSFCGSEERSLCRGVLLCETVTEAADEPFRCK